MSVSRPLAACLALTVLLLGPGAGVAWAQEAPAAEALGTVAVVTEQDDRGRWQPVDAATRAFRIREGTEPEPLTPDMVLQVGDRIETDLARVEIAYATGERLNLVEGTQVTLTAERSTLQALGEVYYRLKAAFRVQTGTVDTVVEGTRFSVAGVEDTGQVRVRVDEGRVRVENDAGAVPVTRGRELLAEASGPPLAGPVRARPGVQDIAKTYPRGRPGLAVDAAVVTELLVDPFQTAAGVSTLRAAPGTRIGASLAVGSLARIRADTTVAAAGARGLRLPQSLGMELGWPGLSLGGGPSVVWERRTLDCGDVVEDLTLGGLAWARKRAPLGRGLALTLEATAGYDSLVRVGLGAGLEVTR